MWIISNDHTKFVELTGMLSVDKVKESYVVLHNGVELVYCDSENAACKIITDIAETIERGVSSSKIYVLPSDKFKSDSLYEMQGMSSFNNILPSNVF